MAITTDTRVVVLGGTSGIGLATAQAAAAAGARVIVASRNPTKVKSALAELPIGSEGSTVDASSSEELAAFFAHVGKFDHLAYTAGDNLVPITLDAYTAEQGRAFLELRVVRALEAVRLAGAAPAGGWIGDSDQRNLCVPRRRRLVPRRGGLGRDRLGSPLARGGAGAHPGQRRRARRRS
ncbi:MAG: hypothetical protein QOH14_1593 [Pseudonocardiales bacterium]|jgi:NAD(P)-dependent dehydrogenase (short-subunit alcohol dehydrogenase family)|nr:hypothetical protein [Pseudonocardiales bacterium]